MEVQESTHFDHWIYSKVQLDEIRKSTHIAAKKGQIAIRSHLSDGNTIDTSVMNTAIALTEDEMQRYLSEKKILLLHFIRFMALSCGYIDDESTTSADAIVLRLRWRVISTAIEFFKRFYLYNSMLAYDPRVIMLGCIYLAGKVEHFYVRVKDVLRLYDKCSDKDVYDSEILLLQGIGYELKINHAVNCNHTLFADYKRYCNSSEVEKHFKQAAIMGRVTPDDPTIIRSWEADSAAYIRAIQLSDATLLFNPTAIAICSLIQTEPTSLNVPFDLYIAHRYGSRLLDILKQQSADIHHDHYLYASKAVDNVELKAAMSRLKKEKLWKSDKEAKKRPRDVDSTAVIS